MKVVFLEDVPNVAQAGEVKDVADGYGRNFLIPQKLALLASNASVSTMEGLVKAKAKLVAEKNAELTEMANQLEGKEVSIKARVGSKDKLYGSITSADIAAGLDNAGLVVDKKKIELAEPIRQLGSYEVLIRLAKEMTPKIKVIVTEEEKEQHE